MMMMVNGGDDCDGDIYGKQSDCTSSIFSFETARSVRARAIFLVFGCNPALSAVAHASESLHPSLYTVVGTLFGTRCL